jgi:hypothetical protein
MAMAYVSSTLSLRSTLWTALAANGGVDRATHFSSFYLFTFAFASRFRGGGPTVCSASLSVFFCAEEVQRNVWDVPDNPTVMWERRNIKEFTWAQWNDPAVFKGSSCLTRDYQTQVLHWTPPESQSTTNMNGPFPTRLIGCSANSHSA